ncbi:hypothetical protein BJX70DRAFT_172662 [Aspergillus crustosus]
MARFCRRSLARSPSYYYYSPLSLSLLSLCFPSLHALPYISLFPYKKVHPALVSILNKHSDFKHSLLTTNTTIFFSLFTTLFQLSHPLQSCFPAIFAFIIASSRCRALATASI